MREGRIGGPGLQGGERDVKEGSWVVKLGSNGGTVRDEAVNCGERRPPPFVTQGKRKVAATIELLRDLMWPGRLAIGLRQRSRGQRGRGLGAWERRAR